MPDIERTLSQEQNDYSINVEDVNYTIEIKPQNKFEIQLNEQGAQGPRGFTGNGISSIIKTSSDGLVDTYTITFTDGNETTFDVTNGNGIDYISLTDIQGLIKTYTIYFDNGDTKTFEVTDGYSPTATVSKSGNVSTITITDKNGTTSTEVYDGEGSITDVTVNGVSVLDNTVAKVIVPTKISDLTDDTSTNPIDKAESLVDQNTGVAKIWTGTLAQYNAIVTKDSDTLYNITDDNTADAYQAYTKNEVDTGFVNVNASNLSANGKKVFDGQWVDSFSQIAQGATYPTSADVAYSLASYLPDDNYSYEVILSGSINTGSSSADILHLTVSSDIITGGVFICGARTRTASSFSASGNTILPVGTERKVYVKYGSGYTGTYNLYIRGYRRIGTNS